MLINEVVVKESYADDLVKMVQDILVLLDSKKVKTIPTEKFKSLLAKQGYVVTTNELRQAVEQSGYANSVNDDEINIGSLPDDVNLDSIPPDVSAMAGSQAMQDINAELPQ